MHIAPKKRFGSTCRTIRPRKRSTCIVDLLTTSYQPPVQAFAKTPNLKGLSLSARPGLPGGLRSRRCQVRLLGGPPTASLQARAPPRPSDAVLSLCFQPLLFSEVFGPLSDGGERHRRLLRAASGPRTSADREKRRGVVCPFALKPAESRSGDTIATWFQQAGMLPVASTDIM